MVKKKKSKPKDIEYPILGLMSVGKLIRDMTESETVTITIKLEGHRGPF